MIYLIKIMKILLVEYAVAVGNKEFLKEGKVMLKIIVKSFSNLGHEVYYLSNNLTLKYGIKIQSNENNFEHIIESYAKLVDAGLVIAPDELLFKLTTIIEKNTINLGSHSNSIKMCVDKLLCTKILNSNEILTPKILQQKLNNGKYVIKPQFGCGSDGVYMCDTFELKDGFITTEYIEGEHISVSLICGNNPLPLTINKQKIEFDNFNINYNGNVVPFKTECDKKIYDIAIKVANILKCKGYIGIDMILNNNKKISKTHTHSKNMHNEKIYVIDVNPRPTTALFGISKVMKEEIGDLLLKNLNNTLPNSVELIGTHSFTKKDII